MLKITKATDPIEVKTIVATIYGVPGLGKTSTAFTAEKPLLLDFDHGSYRSANRGDTVQIQSWADVEGITAADLADFRTLVIDTAGRALDCLAHAIISEDSRNGKGGGGLSIGGYGVLKTRFTSFLRWVRDMGVDVVLIAHSDEQKNGDDLIERIDAQGGSKNEIYKSADLMGRLYLDKGGRRMIDFSPTGTAFGKNPAQLPPLAIPMPSQGASDFLAGVLSTVKAALNKQGAEQAAAATTLVQWAERIGACVGVVDFDGLLTPLKAETAAKDNVWRMIVKGAKAKGFAFDRPSNHFIEAKAKAA